VFILGRSTLKSAVQKLDFRVSQKNIASTDHSVKVIYTLSHKYPSLEAIQIYSCAGIP
jgi:hypothetical protein